MNKTCKILSSLLFTSFTPVMSSAVQLGVNSSATGIQAVALGDEAKASSNQSVAIGANTIASGYAGVAIGGDDIQNNTSAGISERAQFFNVTGTILSTDYRAASASGTASLALGSTSLASGAFSSALGVNSTATGFGAIALGIQAQSTAETSLAFGAASTANGNNAVAIGTSSVAEAENSTSIGVFSQANASGSTAIGANAIASTINSIALGASSTTTAPIGNAYLTNKATSKDDGVISVGNENTLRRIQNVADGAADQDAVTVAQLKVVNNSLTELADLSINFVDGQGGKSENKLSSELAILGDNNIATAITSGQVNISLNKELKDLTSIETTDDINTTIYDATGVNINHGSVTLTTDGLNVAGITVSKSGIDANSQKITNVANGDVSASSKDAINGSQLSQAYDATATSLGGGAKFENGTWTGPSYTVGLEENQVTANNVGDALGALNKSDLTLNNNINTLRNDLEAGLSNTNKRIDQLSKDSKAGIAAAIAIASLPQPIEKGHTMLAVGTGAWEGEMGLSVGASGVTNDKKLFKKPVNYVWKFASTTNSQGHWGGGASVGVQWK